MKLAPGKANLNLSLPNSLGSKIFPGNRFSKILSLVIVGALLLTSCSSATAPLASPNIKLYLLDLTASGNVENQFRLLKDDLFQDMTTRSLGSQESEEGPVLTKFYFVGTNSRAMREFSLQDNSTPYELFTYVSDENNSTRTKKFWRLLTEKYQSYISANLEISRTVSKIECENDFNKILRPTWSSDEVRKVYVNFMCKMATFTLGNYQDLNQYIFAQSQPGVQKASDVFGALSKINTQIKKYKTEFPESKIVVKLATDGDHNLGGSSASNLRPLVLSSLDVCLLAEEMKAKYELDSLNSSENVTVDPRGIAAIVKGTGEYPALLESFWSCFFSE